MEVHAAAKTDVGKRREKNEDAFGCFAESSLFIVADGVGGHAGGEVASRIAVDVVRSSFESDTELPALESDLNGEQSVGARRLVSAIRRANDQILVRSAADPSLKGMGAAAVAVACDERGDRIAVVHVGDTRAYRFRSGAIEQLTEDHTVVQKLLNEGVLTAEEVPSSQYRHILTQALGTGSEIRPSVRMVSVQTGDVILLCSDGIHDLVAPSDMTDILTETAADLDGGCERLIALALERGGHDNATVLLLGFGEAIELPERVVAEELAWQPADLPRGRRGAFWPYVATAVAVTLGALALLPNRGPDLPSPSPVLPPRSEPPATVVRAADLLWTRTTPDATAANGAIGEDLLFRVEAQSTGTDAVRYTWSLDGTPQGEGPSWSYHLGPEAARAVHQVTVLATAGTARLERGWQVRVGRSAAPPVIVRSVPAGDRMIRTADGVARFVITTKEVGGGLLTFAWTRDGAAVAGVEGPELVLDDARAGEAIAVAVRGPDGANVTRTWHVQAAAPPRIVQQVPRGKVVTVEEGASAQFSVRGNDDAAGHLLFRWYLDGAAVRNSGARWMYVAPAGTGTASASHRVAAEATTPTGLRSARVEWEVHVTAAVPKLTLTQPKGPVAKIERGSALPFRAVGRVREGQAIAYEWRVDGAVQAGAGAEEFQLSGDTSSGDHVVEVVAVDAHGLRSAVRRWKVSVLEASPRPE